ncbi:MAG: hypothetical protein J6S58_06855, partial [Lentisphaeria bacterium]|nr:hypothetical protein [Lentisphaeria bacterium]
MMKRSCVLLILLGSGVLLFGTFLLSAGEKSGQSGLSGIFPFAEENRTPVTENADRRAGDNAFAAGDYAVAVSFYTRYLEECRKKDSPEEVLAAYERVLDALVLGKFTPAAVRCLAEYEKLLPENGKNKAELEIWRGEILCQQEKYKEAELLYRKLLAGLSPQDPRSFRVAFSYGLTLEKQKRFREAAGVFVSLWKKRNDKSFLWSRVFQHSVLCLAAAQQWQEAHSMLLEYPPETRSDNETYALLSAYLHLRQHGSRLSCGIWKNLLASFRNKKDPLWYLVASAYADSFLKEGDLHMAQNSYRAAFHAADDNAKIHETLKRMVAVLSAAGDVKKAAALAVRHLELFRHAMLKGDLKLQTAALLRDSARYKQALSLSESVFANMSSSRQEREKALREYALILGKQGRLEEAAKTLRSNLQGKDAADAEFLLAEVLVKLGRKKEFFKVY